MNKKIILLIVILVLVCITAIALISWVFKKTPGEKTLSDSVWPSYDNTEAGFKVSYPPDWKVDEIDKSSEDYKRITLSGTSGEISFDWDGGFGGACNNWKERD